MTDATAALSDAFTDEQAEGPHPTPTIPAGAVEVAGKLYWLDNSGVLKPDEMVKAQHKLEDETVRRAFGFADALSAQIARFREHCFDDIASLLSLLAQEYGDQRGGVKGNVTINSFDGLMRIQLRVNQLVKFGPSLKIAKSLVDQCLAEWAEGARPEIRALIERAFNVDQEGQINRNELLRLRSLAITDPRWLKAMEAISDAQQPDGTKEYVIFHRRTDLKSKWVQVSLSAAGA